MDVSALKAEIKAWERAFRAAHNRDPTTQEIKEQPDIADKYRLYRKLAKQTQQTRSAEPKTPPRGKPHAQSRPSTSASALLSTAQSKSRAVKTEGPAITSNPFSPVKNKAGKHRADNSGLAPFPIPALLSPSARANPFTTPTKSSSRPRARPQIPPPVLEEDPFPPIVRDHTPQRGHLPGFISSTSSPAEHPPEQGNAVSRARKRLRGEAVSPSPVKRARVTDNIKTQPVLTFIREDDEVSDQDSTNVGVHETFIDDTPAKPPPGGKRFKVLFDESISVAQQASTTTGARPNQAQTSLARTKSGKGLFGFGFAPIKEDLDREPSQSRSRAMSPASSQSDEDMDWDAPVPGPSQNRSSSKIKAPDFSPAMRIGPKKVLKNSFAIPSAVIPRKDNLFALAASNDADSTPSTRKRSHTPDPSPSVPSNSRPAPPSLSLLPPSPPPSEANRKPKYLDKGKGRAFARKKAKLHGGADEDDSEDESSESEIRVKELTWSWTNHVRGRVPKAGPEYLEKSSADSEPEFDMETYRRTTSTNQDSGRASEVSRETLDVNLPDNLRRVLALSPPKHTTTDPTDENNIVRGLLYGRREGHYDASRGGEVWGVGEVSDEEGDELTRKKVKDEDEDEDDWEGEPVPWEVGEL